MQLPITSMGRFYFMNESFGWNFKVSLYVKGFFQADKLSLAFITGKSDAVIIRIDSSKSDYLMLALVSDFKDNTQYLF